MVGRAGNDRFHGIDRLVCLEFEPDLRPVGKILDLSGNTRAELHRGHRVEQVKISDHRIGFPKIGAGLAKGDWKLIAQIIDAELAEEDHTLVEYLS